MLWVLSSPYVMVLRRAESSTELSTGSRWVVVTICMWPPSVNGVVGAEEVIVD